MKSTPPPSRSKLLGPKPSQSFRLYEPEARGRTQSLNILFASTSNPCAKRVGVFSCRPPQRQEKRYISSVSSASSVRDIFSQAPVAFRVDIALGGTHHCYPPDPIELKSLTPGTFFNILRPMIQGEGLSPPCCLVKRKTHLSAQRKEHGRIGI